MFVKFANTDVHVYKLKKGVLVEFGDDFYHIEFVHRTQDRRIVLFLDNGFDIQEVGCEHVTWLES